MLLAYLAVSGTATVDIHNGQVVRSVIQGDAWDVHYLFLCSPSYSFFGGGGKRFRVGFDQTRFTEAKGENITKY